MNRIKGGMTLIELLMVMVFIAVLMGVMVYIFQAVLLSWTSEGTRTDVNIASSFTITSMAQDLRQAVAISDNSGSHEIRFGVKRRDASGNLVINQQTGNTIIDYYIYYFYNASDTYPPKLKQISYQLWKYKFNNVPDSNHLTTGTVAYGSGQFIVDNIIFPALNPSNLSVSNNVITIDLTILKGQNEKIRDYSNVSPRNLNNQ